MRILMAVLMASVLLHAASGNSLATSAAAAKFVPGVQWKQDSVLTGAFLCSGHSQQVILGSDGTDIVIAVFLRGLKNRPAVLRDATRDPKTAELSIETMDYSPENVDRELPGFSALKDLQRPSPRRRTR